MQTEKKPFYKTVFFWQILIGTLVVVGLVIGMLVMLRQGPGKSGGKSTEPLAESTAPPTEETLPPLPTTPYSPLDFYYEDGYMTLASGKSSLGVDVSVWQGDIDWQQVKSAGIEFAIIRVGYRGSKEGTLEIDTQAQKNYQGAKAAGLKIGAYFFSQAITPQEAVEEADFLMEQIRDWEIDMPLVFDWEFVGLDDRTAAMTAKPLTDCAVAFCERVLQKGYKPMVYFSQNHSRDGLILPELKDYGFWLAMYKDVMDYPYEIDMWQYTEEGTVPGIKGHVDLNLWIG